MLLPTCRVRSLAASGITSFHSLTPFPATHDTTPPPPTPPHLSSLIPLNLSKRPAQTRSGLPSHLPAGQLGGNLPCRHEAQAVVHQVQLVIRQDARLGDQVALSTCGAAERQVKDRRMDLDGLPMRQKPPVHQAETPAFSSLITAQLFSPAAACSTEIST